MELTKQLVKQMFDTAGQNPIQAGAMTPLCCLQENVSYEGHTLNIVLTHELVEGMHIWHLSVANSNQTAAERNVSEQVVKLFFESPFKELPKYMFPPMMRFMDQYVKILEGLGTVEPKSGEIYGNL
jgi:hypothetical protein